MEIREAAQRIFRVRGLIILACFVAGLLAGFTVHKVFEKTTYTASERLVLGGSVPQTADWASALAGTVQGIVTSPDRIRAALADAGAVRDIVKFTREIDTQSLSDSSILELSVTDTDARVAASVASRLASGAVATLNAEQQQPSEQLEAQLQAEITGLSADIDIIQSKLATAAPNSPATAALLAQQSADAQQLTALITKRADVQQQIAQSVGASVIAPATRPTLADPSRLPLDLVLGALAGLIVGVALAALLESLRPTLVGREAIERALGAPVLGVMTADASRSNVLVISARVRRAAEHVRASTVLLWNRDEDLSDVARRLQATKPEVVRAAGRPSFSIRAAVAAEAVNPRCALVVVVPPVLPLRTIDEAAELRGSEGVSILGAIIMPRRRPMAWHRRHADVTNAPDPEQGNGEVAGDQASAVFVS